MSKFIKHLNYNLNSPDTLIQCAEFCHEFCSSFVFITTQIVNSLYGFGGGLQFILIDIDALVLGHNNQRYIAHLSEVKKE